MQKTFIGPHLRRLRRERGETQAQMARTLGISTSWVSLALLIFGLWMLWRGFSALLQRAYLATLLWWLLAMMVLGWLIN